MRRLLTAGLATAGTLAILTHQLPVPAGAQGSVAATGVAITEVLTRSYRADPEDANAVEISNRTAQPINLGGWTLELYTATGRRTVEFVFRSAPLFGGGFVIVKDPNYRVSVLGAGTIYNYQDQAVDELPDGGGVILRNGDVIVDSVAMTADHLAVIGDPAEKLNPETDAVGQEREHDVTIQRGVLAGAGGGSRASFDRHLANWLDLR